MLCQTQNPSKAEAAGTEAREGRSGPPRPAPPATAPQPAERRGRAGSGRTPGRPGLRGGAAGGGRERPQDGGSAAAARGAARVSAAASAPRASPALESRLPRSTRAERAPAAPGAALVAAASCPQPRGREAGQGHPPLSARGSVTCSSTGPIAAPAPGGSLALNLLLPFQLSPAVRALRNTTPCFPRAVGSTDLSSQSFPQ